MTLDTILRDLYRRFSYTASPDSAVTVRLSSWVNTVQRKILTDPDFANLIRHQITFASVADRDYYSLPPSIVRIISLRDTAGQRTLREMSEAWYRSHLPSPADDTGTPDFYVPLGYFSVARRPSAAVEVFIKSDSASDTQTAYWEVITSTGSTRTGSVTLNGTTAVSFDTTLTNIIEVVDLYLSSSAVGRISLNETSGAGTEFSSINIGKSRGHFYRIALVPTPSSAVTYTADAEREVADLYQGQDEPVLPKRFHDLLTDGAEMMEWAFKDDEAKFRRAEKAYDRGIGQLRATMAGSEAVIPGGPHGRGWSPLGANFPAESSY